MKNFIINTLIFLLISGRFAGANPGIKSYNLRYQIDFKNESLSCVAVLALEDDIQADSVNFILYRLLKVKAVKDENGNLLKIKQQVVEFSDYEIWQVNYVTVYFAIKQSEKLLIEFQGHLFGYDETAMKYIKDNINPEFTILRPDCFSYPVISDGLPSVAKLKKALSGKFDYTVSVKVPDSLVVINGGRLISKTKNNGWAEYIYQNIKPAWRIDVTIAKYSTKQVDGFSIHYFTKDSAGLKRFNEAFTRSYSLCQNWFGEPPLSQSFSIIEIPNGWGSQTDITCILQEASAFRDAGKLQELYHEVSHVWNVSMLDPNPCRVEQEGLATFLQFLIKEKLDNRTGIVDSAASGIFEKLKLRLIKDSVLKNTPIIDYGVKSFTNISYTKGMLFYYLLYKTLGEEKFLNTIKEFYYTYLNTGATTKQFTNFLIEKSNSGDINQIVEDWIYTNKSSFDIIDKSTINDLLMKLN